MVIVSDVHLTIIFVFTDGLVCYAYILLSDAFLLNGVIYYIHRY